MVTGRATFQSRIGLKLPDLSVVTTLLANGWLGAVPIITEAPATGLPEVSVTMIAESEPWVSPDSFCDGSVDGCGLLVFEPQAANTAQNKGKAISFLSMSIPPI